MTDSKEKKEKHLPFRAIRYFFYHYTLMLLLEIVQSVAPEGRRSSPDFIKLLVGALSLSSSCYRLGRDNLPTELKEAVKEEESRIVVPIPNIVSPN